MFSLSANEIKVVIESIMQTFTGMYLRHTAASFSAKLSDVPAPCPLTQPTKSWCQSINNEGLPRQSRLPRVAVGKNSVMFVAKVDKKDDDDMARIEKHNGQYVAPCSRGVSGVPR